jgi:hypothetical protein
MRIASVFFAILFLVGDLCVQAQPTTAPTVGQNAYDDAVRRLKAKQREKENQNNTDLTAEVDRLKAENEKLLAEIDLLRKQLQAASPKPAIASDPPVKPRARQPIKRPSLGLHFSNEKVDIEVTDIYSDLSPSFLWVYKDAPAADLLKNAKPDDYEVYVAFTITNKDDRRVLNYQADKFITMTDDVLNEVSNHTTFYHGKGIPIGGGTSDAELKPAEKLSDVHVFSMPLTKTKSLTLTFSKLFLIDDPGNFPLADDVKFTFTPDQIRNVDR